MHQSIPGVANCDVPSSTWLSAAPIKQPTTMLRTVKGTTVGPKLLDVLAQVAGVPGRCRTVRFLAGIRAFASIPSPPLSAGWISLAEQ
jgi:hypothetical protein